MDEIPMGDRPPFFNVNLGHILTILLILGAGAGAFYGMRAELQNVGYRVERIETSIQQLTNLTVVTATQTEKITNLDKRIDRIEQRLK